MLNHTQSYKRRNTSATTININEYDGSQTTETKIHVIFHHTMAYLSILNSVSTIQIALVLQSNTFIAPLSQACFFYIPWYPSWYYWEQGGSNRFIE